MMRDAAVRVAECYLKNDGPIVNPDAREATTVNSEAVYIAEHIEAATGGNVTPALIRLWSSRGYLSRYLEPKAGRPLKFKFSQVCAIALMSELDQFGVELEKAAGWANAAMSLWHKRQWARWLAFTPREAMPHYVPEADLKEFEKAMPENYRRACIRIDVEDICRSVYQTLESMQENAMPRAKRDFEELVHAA
jgi:hypothetical protein